jgi:hypothetical protein
LNAVPSEGATWSRTQGFTAFLTETVEQTAELERILASLASSGGGESRFDEVVVLTMGSAEEAATAQRTIRLLELEAGVGRIHVVDTRRQYEALSVPAVLPQDAAGCDTDELTIAC